MAIKKPFKIDVSNPGALPDPGSPFVQQANAYSLSAATDVTLGINNSVNKSNTWATPTSGNLLVAFVGADDKDWVLDIPTGWTLQESIIGSSTFKPSGWLLSKSSDGTENTIVFETVDGIESSIVQVQVLEFESGEIIDETSMTQATNIGVISSNLSSVFPQTGIGVSFFFVGGPQVTATNIGILTSLSEISETKRSRSGYRNIIGSSYQSSMTFSPGSTLAVSAAAHIRQV